MAVTAEADYRLPRTAVPRQYDLELAPDLTARSFRGRAVITVEQRSPASSVVVNVTDLDIERAVYRVDGGRELTASVEYQTELERAVLRLPEEVPVGEARLEIDYSGVLNDRLHGFYRSTYRGDDGVERILATTQFEATDARRAFPCWDEPDLKAVFRVSLVVPAHCAAVSSGRVVARTAVGDGRDRVEFAETMPLSTYLLAFVVGDLEATEPVDVDGTPLRVLATPGKLHLAEFALEAGAHALRYFSDYYGIPYPGDKLDLIAIPDFSAGAMENLGAVTFRESALLVDPELATQAELERVAAVVGHEIAHMWFGDLVTMRWWNGTWLKEAFASFMEIKSTDAFRPDWHVWESFSLDRDEAMEIDALGTTRSIEYPVHSPEDADAMFDTITYDKGAAVLRMLEGYLGEETFRAGIREYLRRHAYGNTETADLWAALEAASGEPVGQIADDWVFQGGFPQVHVEQHDGGVVLRHECFRYIGDAPHRWRVPVLYRSGGDVGRLVLEDSSVIEAGDRVVVNAGGHGFFRTRYAPGPRNEILERWVDLGIQERLAWISDAFAHVLAGDIGVDEYLSLLRRLGAEPSPAVWQVVLRGMDELDRIASSDDRVLLQSFVQRLVRGPLSAVGWSPSPDEPVAVRRRRGVLLQAMGTLGADREVRTEATVLAGRWLGVPTSLDGDVATAVLAISASVGDRSSFERFLGARAHAASPQDEVRLLRAAADVPDRSCSLALLEMVLDGTIRRQDSFWVVARLLGQRDTGAAVWEAVRSEWDAVVDAMPPQNARLLLQNIHHRSEPDVAEDIRVWLEAHPIKGSEQLIAQQLERLAVRVALRHREANRLGEVFAAQGRVG